jgi:hypothetical protein
MIEPFKIPMDSFSTLQFHRISNMMLDLLENFLCVYDK